MKYILPALRSLQCAVRPLLALLIVTTCALPARAEIGKEWRLRSPLPTPETLNGIAWTGSLLVAVGNNGTMLTSTDGATWAFQQLGRDDFSSVAWSGTSLLAVNPYPNGNVNVWTSTDGLAWQSQTATLPGDGSGNLLNAIWTGTAWAGIVETYGPNAATQTLATSMDGLTWSAAGELPASPSKTNYRHIAAMTWTGTYYVVVGYDGDSNNNDHGFIFSSTDGTAWTSASVVSSPSSSFQVNDVTWTGTQAVAVDSTGGIYTSPTGQTWTKQTAAAGTSNIQFNNILWTGMQLVASGQDVQTSTDGITWAEVTRNGLYENVSVWTGTQAVAAGYGGSISTSTDGNAWTRVSPLSDNSNLVAIVSTPAGFVAMNQFGGAALSTTGDTWTTNHFAQVNPTSVAWTGAQLVAVGNAFVATSPDGTTWSVNTTSFHAGEQLNSVVASGGQLVTVGKNAAGTGAVIATSPDGASWTPHSVSYPGLRRVAYVGTQWLAVGDKGTILTSPTGITWTKRTSGTTNSLAGIASSGSLIVVVGDAGTILTSTNGSAWTAQTAPAGFGQSNPGQLFSVVWTGSNFVALGDGALTSPNGLVWTLQDPGTNMTFRDAVWDGSQLLAVGDAGMVRSTDAMPHVQFDTTGQSVPENGGPVYVSLSLSFPAVNSVTVPLTVGGTAVSGSNYNGSNLPAAVTFAPGDTTKFVTLDILDNGVVQPDQTLSLTLGAPTGGRLGTQTTHVVTITDTDGSPTVQFTNTAVTAQEQVDVVGAQIELGWPAPSTITVPVTVSGTATGGDFTGVPASVTFNAGEVSKFITITVTDDNLVESDETVILTLGAPTGATLGTNTTFTLTIQDNDPVTQPGRSWTLRQPLPSADGLNAIASSPSRAVIVGDSGAAITSDDQGATWVRRFTGASSSINCNAVIYTGTAFIAPCDSGHALTSPDGVLWADIALPGASDQAELRGAASQGSHSVIVGEDLIDVVNDIVAPVIYLSLDNVHWVAEALPANALDNRGQLWGVASTGSQFVAVGSDSNYTNGVLTSVNSTLIFTSPDGREWTDRSAGLQGVALTSVVWAGNKLVAFDGSKNAYTSPDGIAWTKRSLGSLGAISHGAWSGAKLLGVGQAVSASADGLAWTQKASPSKSLLNGVTWSGSSFIAISASEGIYTSLDGLTWTRRGSGPDLNDWLLGVVWSGTQFVAVGGDLQRINPALIVTSPDGVTWTQRATTVKTPLISVAWSGKLFAATGIDGAILTSADGISWTPRASGTNLDLHAVIWAANQFVVVGGHETGEQESTGPGGSIVLTSPDGIAWTRRTIPTVHSLEGIAFNGSLFVATGRAFFDGGETNGEILTSPDGVNWTERSSGVSQLDIHGIAWSGRLFVAATDQFGIIHSPDGITWTAATAMPALPPNSSSPGLSGVCWTGSNFVAVGDNGISISSTDGDTWTPQQTELHGGHLFGAAWNGATLVAVGTNASIQTSGPGGTIPTPTVQFAATSSSIIESGGTANILVTMSSAPTTQVTVPFTLSPGPGLMLTGPQADVVVPASPLVFNPGESSKYLSILIKNDNVPESNETLAITLGAIVGGATPGAILTHTLTIIDDDVLPVVSSPASQLLAIGSPLTLSVTASGSGALAYQWKKNNAVIAGSTSPVYYVGDAALATGGAYTCTVTNAVGSTTSAVAQIGVYESVAREFAVTGTKDTVLTQAASSNVAFKWYKDASPTELAASATIVYSSTKSAVTLKQPFTSAQAGSYVCKPELTSASLSATGDTFAVDIIAAKPTLDPVTLPNGAIGTPYASLMKPNAASAKVATWSASGLPAGLAMDPNTGSISGSPSAVATSKPVTITATNALGSASVATKITITGMPAALIGTTVGLVARDPGANNNLGARITWSVTAVGSFTGSYIVGGATQPFTGQVTTTDLGGGKFVANGASTFAAGGKIMSVSIQYAPASSGGAIGSGSVSATSLTGAPLGTALFSTQPALAAPATYAGLYHFVLRLPVEGDVTIPQGYGFGTVTATTTGAVTFAGKTGDGSVVTASSYINVDGTSVCYASLYGGNGSLVSQPMLTVAGSAPAYADSTIIDVAAPPNGPVGPTWSKLPDTTAAGARNYPAGWLRFRSRWWARNMWPRPQA